MKKSIFAILVTALTLFGCSGEVENLRWASFQKDSTIAKLNADLGAAQKALALRQAIDNAEVVGKQVPRTAGFRHTSGCNSVPANLAREPGFAEFRMQMVPAYVRSCRTTTLEMATERKLEARKLAAAKHRQQLALAKQRKR
ncbi:hypothetical protein A3F27_00775 [Candidatus Kaiserbacteria bacterium RIFCSPHIGHO2_12_FULL_53_13]|uniref:Lipoprotein n=1 Tax=Candidatus Kaiserbacteria bacterium RIFCSPHIGHO2_12_FULL_53_13 TaxID=1798502 RepID=A0A1F6E837_9BACT|nr:MAG: hypothetical protein A3F27_00775 [Candidatus Kaiserbacteria bacterium RIFCSPHIGHO2_12_FULL_53_13]OGG74612.1 MAG: hypothetical protein A3A37_02020 [Candidatus Kaiserbacteria bacterium RIFCSPLOWO2_01_FULL_52_36]